jgi:hypothetical protein
VTLERLLSRCSGTPTDTEKMLDLYFNVDVFDYNLSELRRKDDQRRERQRAEGSRGSPFQYADFGYLNRYGGLDGAHGISSPLSEPGSPFSSLAG